MKRFIISMMVLVCLFPYLSTTGEAEYSFYGFAPGVRFTDALQDLDSYGFDMIDILEHIEQKQYPALGGGQSIDYHFEKPLIIMGRGLDTKIWTKNGVIWLVELRIQDRVCIKSDMEACIQQNLDWVSGLFPETRDFGKISFMPSLAGSYDLPLDHAGNISSHAICDAAQKYQNTFITLYWGNVRTGMRIQYTSDDAYTVSMAMYLSEETTSPPTDTQLIPFEQMVVDQPFQEIAGG